MKKHIYTIAILLFLFACNDTRPNKNASENENTNTKDAEKLTSEDSLLFNQAKDAYTWSYPMVIVGVTAMVATDVDKPMPNAHAPINEMGNVSKLLTAADKDVVSSNADNMYSNAFLDLTQGAALLAVPNTNKRYYSMMLSDAYTNVFDYVGSRTTGSGAGQYLIVGPDWKGNVPANVKKVFKAPTNLVWVIGRTLVDGLTDVENVHKIQEGYKISIIAPASKSPTWRTRLKVPALTSKMPPVELVNNMDWKTYFTWVGELMKDNAVPASQQAQVDAFKSLGLNFANGFDTSYLNIHQQQIIANGMKAAFEEMKTRSNEKMGTDHEGWSYNLDAAKWGDDYLTRAAIAYRSIGQNTSDEAIYINTVLDKNGNRLDASVNNYSVTFPKGQLPPADAFWSITMYDENNFFVQNPINRLAIGDRTKEMKPNADGSLSIYFQKDAPKGKEGNWLPTPNGKFRLSLRLYVPNNKILNGGTWVPPGVVKTN